jgi:Na+/H+ antiporter NhaD/arsenite permease-like protein
VALLTGTILWILLRILSPISISEFEEKMMTSLGEISGIIFFIFAALIIVELIDSHNGFSYCMKIIPTNYIRTFTLSISLIAFFFSAILDNLTTTVVMISIVKKVKADNKKKIILASLIILAANAGGIWSPMGDITTTMLWVSGKLSVDRIIFDLFIPSLFSFLIPLIICLLFYFDKNEVITMDKKIENNERSLPVLIMGVSLLALVPVLKGLLHIPPYLAILFVLSIFWIYIEFFIQRKNSSNINVVSIIKKIDYSSIIFFLGILLAVNALNESGVIKIISSFLLHSDRSFIEISFGLGIISAIIDNIPLLAAVIKIYSLGEFPQNHNLWLYLAYATGFGGNLLVIGSAAGVAAMSLLEIRFFGTLDILSLLFF